MSRHFHWMAAALAAALSLGLAAPASAAWYAKIAGVKGASKDAKHLGWLEVKGFDCRMDVAAATGGAGAGKVKFNEFTIKKTSDAASPALRAAADKRAKYADVMIAGDSAGEQTYLAIKLENVQITSYQLNASGGVDESISFVFEKLRVTYNDGRTGAACPRS